MIHIQPEDSVRIVVGRTEYGHGLAHDEEAGRARERTRLTGPLRDLGLSPV